jgi:diguanylate cyclase (GGDEF)-like protein
VATSTERRRQLREIEQRGWQLWTVSLVITAVLTLGIVLSLYPVPPQSLKSLAERHGILPQLLLGLATLVILSGIYLITKEYELTQMRNFIVATFAENALLRETCPTDPLTGALDRSALPEVLQRETSRSDRNDSRLCLVLVDIRDFTRLNETKGNLGGDTILKDLARSLVAVARRTDIVLRYGADEFLCFLPGTSGEGGAAFVRRVRAALKQIIRLRALILDVGIAVYTQGQNGETILAEAERRLAEAQAESPTLTVPPVSAA